MGGSRYARGRSLGDSGLSISFFYEFSPPSGDAYEVFTPFGGSEGEANSLNFHADEIKRAFTLVGPI